MGDRYEIPYRALARSVDVMRCGCGKPGCKGVWFILNDAKGKPFAATEIMMDDLQGLLGRFNELPHFHIIDGPVGKAH